MVLSDECVVGYVQGVECEAEVLLIAVAVGGALEGSHFVADPLQRAVEMRKSYQASRPRRWACSVLAICCRMRMPEDVARRIQQFRNFRAAALYFWLQSGRRSSLR